MTYTIKEALEIITQHARPVSTQIVPIEEAVGRTVAQDISAQVILPKFDNSAMDGYAVRCAQGGLSVKVIDTIFAGSSDDLTMPQEGVYKIMTGACTPKGCEAIVPIEDVTIDENGLVTLPLTIKAHAHIRKSAEDIDTGKTLIKKGSTVFGYHLALLASQGISHISVYRKVRVAVFATGQELAMHFEHAKPHQIYNSNTPALLGRAKELGAEVFFVGSAQDNIDDIKHHVQEALQADVIITSGGVSVGDADFTKEVFDSFGISYLFERIDIKPGKPTSLGRIDTTWVLNLPGNPLAAMVNFEIFGRTLLALLSASSTPFHATFEAKAHNEFRIKKGRTTVLLGVYDGATFSPLDKQSPGMISAFIEANAFIILSDTVDVIPKNSPLKVMLLHQAHYAHHGVSMITEA